MNELNSPFVLALLAAIPAFTLGILAYLRSRKVDKATEKNEAVTVQSTAVGQVIDGLNKLIDNLQEDNKELRSNLRDLSIKLKEVTNIHEALKKQMNDLKRKYKIKD